MTAMKTARMTGGAAMVEGLLRNGVDTLFALPGVQLNHFFDAVYDKRNALRVLNARHELGAAYMAFGYAIATGRVGAFAVVPGPGILNTTAALSTAYGCSQPVLAITGQINAAAIDRGFGLLHEIHSELKDFRARFHQQSIHELSVRRAPEPMDIHWHHIGFSIMQLAKQLPLTTAILAAFR